jgi:DNA polymerase III sliding clamp (beta) subunit (PCNA family)
MSKVTSKKPSLPMLSNIYIGNNMLLSTDEEFYVVTNLPTDIECIIPKDVFLSASKTKNDLSIDSVDGKVRIVYGGVSHLLPMSVDLDIYPRLPDEDSVSEKLVLGSTDVYNIITASKLVSNDELKPVMCGIFLGDNIVSTDGYSLYRSARYDSKFTCILPSKIAKIITVGSTIQTVSNSYAKVVVGDVVVYVRTIYGMYPKYDAVIPETYKISFTDIPIHPFKEILAICKANKMSKEATMVLNFVAGNPLSIIVSDNISDLRIDISTEYHCSTDFIIALSPYQVANILSCLLSDKFTMKVTSSDSIVGIDDNFVVMPYKL